MTRDRTASRLTRILAMLPWVIANPGTTVADVGERFGYKSERELAADLEMIFVCGLPGYGPGDLMVAFIDDDEVVVDMADYFEDAPRLTPTEMLSMLAAGMAVIAAGQASPALESAVDKLATTVSPDGGEGLAVEVDTEPDLVGPLRDAIGSSRAVEITYTSIGRNETSTRIVEPWLVFTSIGNWYLLGHCRSAQDERMFRVDRIRGLNVIEETFEPPPSVPEPVVRYSPTDDDVTCDIRLSHDSRWVLDYYPVEVLDDDGATVTIRFSAMDPSVAARLLLRLGDRAELVAGVEVKAELERLGGRMLARYEVGSLDL